MNTDQFNPTAARKMPDTEKSQTAQINTLWTFGRNLIARFFPSPTQEIDKNGALDDQLFDPSEEEPIPSDAGLFDTRKIIIAGTTLILIAFGGLGGWAALAPLSSAAIAPGAIRVAGERQSVQHLEGGIIEEILISEDAHVDKNEVLLRIENPKASANLDSLKSRLVALAATAARLVAERDGAEQITYGESLTQAADSDERKNILAGEQGVFQTRLLALHGQKNILNERVQQYEDEIRGLHAQEDATQAQLGYVREELEAATVIYEKGMYDKPRYLSIKRAAAKLDGQVGEYESRIAQAKQKIGETRLQIIDLDNRRISEAATRLQAINQEILRIQEGVEAAEDIVHRLDVRAPESGTVVGLEFHTLGGVIPPGAHILDIVPDDAALVVEAQVRAQDIDVVTPGLPCEVQLTAYSARYTARVRGTVVQVSADSFVDPVTFRSYYKTLVEIDPQALSELEDVRLYPGMPAEVFIQTGQRTALQYLIAPIEMAIQRAWRE